LGPFDGYRTAKDRHVRRVISHRAELTRESEAGCIEAVAIELITAAPCLIDRDRAEALTNRVNQEDRIGARGRSGSGLRTGEHRHA
jgi:hypothetical protein